MSQLRTDATAPYNLQADHVLASLGTSRHGLSPEEAARRLLEYGRNELQREKGISPLEIFLGQFKSFLIIILLAAAVVSFAIGERLDAIVIGVIVLFASGLGFVQEYRAEKAMEALKRMAALTSTVVRDGEDVDVPAAEVVPGDIVVLSTGDRVPADCRLLEAWNLNADEASLTGESLPVEKTVEAIEGEAALGDRRNMVYSGTCLTFGRGVGVAVATGMATEFGKIAGMLQKVEMERTPLQADLDKMGRWIGVASLSICALVGTLGYVLGAFEGDDSFDKLTEAFIWAVSLAVAAVPEALPAVVTISLALGVRRMVHRHALVRRLPIVETLGCTTVICSDKTGTLTRDEMTVRRVYVDGQIIEVTGAGYEPAGHFIRDGSALSPASDPSLLTLLRACALCNDSHVVRIDGQWDVRGDPTEGALMVLAAKAGMRYEALTEQFPRSDEIPFSSESKRMTTIHSSPEGTVAFSKGAPEVVLGSCDRVSSGGEVRALTPGDRDQVAEQARLMAGQALRVLGLAYKPLAPDLRDKADAERGMVFVGLVGMIDPPREEAKDAISVCAEAGIKTIMITGDHKLTAVAVAKELGLLNNGIAISGAELDAMSDQQFNDLVNSIEVYARTSPAHKMRVVDALIGKGHIVAMTGDGVNDAPALKKSHIGVAMGITGTDVTKETADMVLTDDNFASIVAAVEEGRAIFGNIKKYLMYLLSCNIGEILFLTIAVLAGLPLPLVAVQILFVNLATDGLPAIALSFDPPEPDLMKRGPRATGQSIFTRPVLAFLGGTGIWTAVVTLAVFMWARETGKVLLECQSMAFVTLVLVEFFQAFNCRSEKYSLFKVGVFKNGWLLAAVASQLILLNILVYVPALHDPFNTHSLSVIDWVVAISSASTMFLVVEAGKWLAAHTGQTEPLEAPGPDPQDA